MLLGGGPLGARLAQGGAGSDFQSFSTQDTLVRRGASILGLSYGDLTVHWEDWLASTSDLTGAAAWQRDVVGASSVTTGNLGTNANGYRSGVARVGTAATANSLIDYYSQAKHIGHSGTESWYYCAIAKAQTAIDAQTSMGVGIFCTGGPFSLLMGVMGPSSTANFRLQYDGYAAGSFADLGLAIDTNFHFWEMWVDGDSPNQLNAQVDRLGAVTVNLTTSAIDQAWASAVLCRNGTTAAVRRIDIDFALVLSSRGRKATFGY